MISHEFNFNSVNQPDPFILKCGLKLYYQNVRGLRTKTAEFSKSSLSCCYGAVALSETSLNEFFFDSELFNLTQFSVYRNDRSELNSTHLRFGGVLIAVRTYLSSERILVPDTENVEIVIVKIDFQSHLLYICCLYIPSGSSVGVYNEYHDIDSMHSTQDNSFGGS